MLQYYPWFPSVQESLLERSLTEWSLHVGQAVIQIGVIVGSSQQHQLHFVRVSGSVELQCPAAIDDFGPIYGVRRSGLYSIGTMVLVMRTGDLGGTTGIILAAVPENNAIPGSSGFSLYTGSDELVGGSPAGTEKDPISSSLVGNDGSKAWNSGRPIDVYPGDYASLGDFGVGFWTGPLVTVMRAGHDCAIECHYTDNLLRLLGYNYELWTAGSETSVFDDYGEINHIFKVTPFSWEAMGSLDPLGLVSKEGEKRDQNVDRCGSLEPIEDDPAAHWRLLRLTGLLGDLESTYVSVPDYEASTDTQRKRAEEEPQQGEIGVFHQRIGIDGAYHLSSAKSIAFVKECLIPIPREVYPADDARGDTEGSLVKDNSLDWTRLKREEAKFEDLDPELEDPVKHGSAVLAANTEDKLAHEENYKSKAPVILHLKDWYLPEIQELTLGANIIEGLRGKTEVLVGSDKYWASRPDIANIKIDLRTESAQYYISRSLFVMHEDGAIHLEDGYGAQISLRGGSMDLSAPGDITIRPGRDFVVLAGKDANIVGGCGVEIAAQAGDTKIAAHRNLEILGGNDGKGGVLIESKASGLLSSDVDYPSQLNALPTTGNAIRGIWLKCPKSSISIMGLETILTTEETGGQVIIDSGDNGTFITMGKNAIFNNESIAFFPYDPQQDEIFTRFYMDSNTISMVARQTSILSDLLLSAEDGGTNRVTLNGNLSILGNVGSSMPEGMMGVISDSAIDNFRAQLSADIAIADASVGLIETILTQKNEELDESIYRNEDVLEYLSFHFLSTQDRGVPIDQILLPEASWQRRFRESSVGADLKEYPVIVGSIDTLPWPGAEARQAEAYGIQKPRFIEEATGFAIDRGDGETETEYTNAVPAMEGHPFTEYYKLNEENKTPETRLIESEGD